MDVAGQGSAQRYDGFGAPPTVEETRSWKNTAAVAAQVAPPVVRQSAPQPVARLPAQPPSRFPPHSSEPAPADSLSSSFSRPDIPQPVGYAPNQMLQQKLEEEFLNIDRAASIDPKKILTCLERDSKKKLNPNLFRNSRNSEGDWLLHWAIREKFGTDSEITKQVFTSIVDLLCAYPQLDVAAQNEHGEIALLLAAAYGDVETVKLLLRLLSQQDPRTKQRKFDINAKTDEGHTALHMAVWGGGCQEVVRLLLASEGIEADVRDNKNRSPLWMAARKDRVDIARQLLAEDIEPSAVGPEGTTPLHCAVAKKSEDMVRLLLNDKRVSRTLKDKGGKTAYQRALDTQNKRIIALFGGGKLVPVALSMLALIAATYTFYKVRQQWTAIGDVRKPTLMV